MGTVQDVGRVYNTLLGGSGMRVRAYPTGVGVLAAVGITLTSDGAAFTYPAALSANIKAFFVAGTVTTNWRYFGFEPFVPVAAAEEYFVLLGASTTVNPVLTKATSLLEICIPAITVATGQFRPVYFPYAATVVADGLNDSAVGGMGSTVAAADTLTAHVLIATLLGS